MNNYVVSGTTCVIGRTTTAINTRNGVAFKTTTGCAISTIRGGEELMTRTGRAITSATHHVINRASGWSKRRVVDAWQRASKKVIRKSKSLPKLPAIPKPKDLLATIGNKANNLRRKKKNKAADPDEAAADFGDGGLWQRAILMGDKCQPLDFAGVIYYDSKGRRVSEPPSRSPRRFPGKLHDSGSSGEL
ncbi:unnamed protein product [Cuscuta campestris]|nr:unnamed protein product [Cuscuta campestris]